LCRKFLSNKLAEIKRLKDLRRYGEKANFTLNLLTIEQYRTIRKMAEELSRLREQPVDTILQEYLDGQDIQLNKTQTSVLGKVRIPKRRVTT